MPDRMIRATCCTSRNLLRVSGDAERLFFRLTTQADDLGRFRADASLVLAGCFPRALEEPELMARFSMAAITGWLAELERAELVQLYDVNGSRFGAFVTWSEHQRLRNSKGKFPPPPLADDCRGSPQFAADSREVPQPAADDGGVPLARAGAGASPSDSVSDLSSETAESTAEDLTATETLRVGSGEGGVPPRRRVSPNQPWKRLHGVHEWDWPFIEAWEARFENPPDDVRELCAGLDSLRDRPRGEVLARWRRYLDPAINGDKPQFLKSRKFAATYGHWAEGAPAGPARPAKGLAAVENFMAEALAKEAAEESERLAAAGGTP